MKFRLLGLALVLLSLVAVNNKAEATQDCPTKHFNGTCTQVITYAKNPTTGTCCTYPNPCVVPDGWQTSTSGCPL